MEIFQQLVNGISLGSIYALIALGYTMVYGIVKLINFAHGDVFMVGAFIGFYSITILDLGFFQALLLSMAACAIFGVLIEKIAYKPLRNATRIAALITAIGVSLLIEYGMIYIRGHSLKPIRVMFCRLTVLIFLGFRLAVNRYSFWEYRSR